MILWFYDSAGLEFKGKNPFTLSPDVKTTLANPTEKRISQIPLLTPGKKNQQGKKK